MIEKHEAIFLNPFKGSKENPSRFESVSRKNRIIVTRLNREKPVVIQKGIAGLKLLEKMPPTSIETIQLTPPRVAIIP